MRTRIAAFLLLCLATPAAEITLSEQTRRYLIDLTRIDTTNPPGRETAAARYLERIAAQEGIACELLGPDPERLSFVARLPGNGKRRPLLLMAHTDVVPADSKAWSVPPFAALERDGFIYGRGVIDDKSLLAAELAVMVDLKRSGITLDRDLIILAEADEEAGSTAIQWIVAKAWRSIDAEFALNEGGLIADFAATRVYHIQTTEKIPTRVTLRATGPAGHGSLPLPDNAVVALSRALVKLADADQPVQFNETTRAYFAAVSRLEAYRWLAPLMPRLLARPTAAAAAHELRARDPELNSLLRTTVAPTMLSAGLKINIIPGAAEAQVDVRRLPSETAPEVLARLRRIVNDRAVEIAPAPGQLMPPAPPSPLDTALYRGMQQVFLKSSPGAVVTPYMQRGATDGAFLRARGMPVYGVPLFLKEDKENRAHGNDERISSANLAAGAALLRDIVLAVDKLK
jgi:acetylornithine deacetylase/succinyl-diaminopimelate desuccinylase-like protein